MHIRRLGTRFALYLLIFGSVIAGVLTLAFDRFEGRSAVAIAEQSLVERAHQAAHFVEEILSSRVFAAETLASIDSIKAATVLSTAEMAVLPDEVRLSRIADLDARWQQSDSLNDAFVAEYTENAIAQQLRAQLEAHPGVYGEIFLTNRFGALIASTGKLTTLAHGHKAWWQASFAEGQGQPYIDDRGFDASVGDYVVGVVVPVRVDGHVTGILKCNFLVLTDIGDALACDSEEGDPEILLARASGLIVSGPEGEPLQSALPQDVVRAINEHGSESVVIKSEEASHLFAFSEVFHTDGANAIELGGTPESLDHSHGNQGETWFAVTRQSLNQILAPAAMAANRMNLATHGVITAMVILAALIGWRLARPVSHLASQVRAFGPDSLDQRVAMRRSDEIGELAQSFNAVADRLESSVVSKEALLEEVSRRKLVEDVLRTSERKYRQLFENMTSGFALHEIVLNEAGEPIDYVFLDINDAFEKVAGLQKHEIVGRRVTEVLPGIEDDPAKWIAVYGETALTGKAFSFEQYSTPLNRWFSISVYSPREGQFATIVDDITQRKTMEKERQAMEIRLMQSQKLESVGILAGGVAHEINNPLMGMLNYVELVRDGVQSPEPLKYLDEIEREGNRIATIVKSLLQFSRKSGQDYGIANLGDIVDGALALVSSSLRRDHIVLQRDIPKDLPTVRCSHQQIQQVVINLLMNARDALNDRYPAFHEDKRIHLTARSLERSGSPWIRLTVEDHGSGIPPGVIDRVFEPFFSTKERHEGTGLGLSVSFGIVRDHSGKLTVESVPGETTQFHVDLPQDSAGTSGPMVGDGSDS